MGNHLISVSAVSVLPSLVSLVEIYRRPEVKQLRYAPWPSPFLCRLLHHQQQHRPRLPILQAPVVHTHCLRRSAPYYAFSASSRPFSPWRNSGGTRSTHYASPSGSRASTVASAAAATRAARTPHSFLQTATMPPLNALCIP